MGWRVRIRRKGLFRRIEAIQRRYAYKIVGVKEILANLESIWHNVEMYCNVNNQLDTTITIY